LRDIEASIARRLSLQTRLPDCKRPDLTVGEQLGAVGPLSGPGFGRSVLAAFQCVKELTGRCTVSRPGARYRHCCLPVSPGRSPNPAYTFPRTGLSTVLSVRHAQVLSRRWGSWDGTGNG